MSSFALTLRQICLIIHENRCSARNHRDGFISIALCGREKLPTRWLINFTRIKQRLWPQLANVDEENRCLNQSSMFHFPHNCNMEASIKQVKILIEHNYRWLLAESKNYEKLRDNRKLENREISLFITLVVSHNIVCSYRLRIYSRLWEILYEIYSPRFQSTRANALNRKVKTAESRQRQKKTQPKRFLTQFRRQIFRRENYHSNQDQKKNLSQFKHTAQCFCHTLRSKKSSRWSEEIY